MINVKELRASLPSVIRRVQGGQRITVLYRGRPAFRIVPVDGAHRTEGTLESDPLFRARAVGRSRVVRSAADHDAWIYGA